jgi:hypothetical protein
VGDYTDDPRSWYGGRHLHHIAVLTATFTGAAVQSQLRGLRLGLGSFTVPKWTKHSTSSHGQLRTAPTRANAPPGSGQELSLLPKRVQVQSLFWYLHRLWWWCEAGGPSGINVVLSPNQFGPAQVGIGQVGPA